MKKVFTIALAAIFVLGLAATSFAADVTFGGDLRVRGVWNNNLDFADGADTKGDQRYWDQRLRLTADIDAGSDVMVKTRMTVSEGHWGSAPGGSNVTVDQGQNAGDNSTWGNVRLDADDYAYIVVPMGQVTVSAGRMLADWGNKFMAWQAPKNRVKLTAKVGELNVGFFIDKNREMEQSASANLGLPAYNGDSDSYVVPVTGSFGDIKAGAIGILTIDDLAAMNGFILDGFFRGPVGPVSLAAELALQFGELNEDAAGNSKTGFFIAADYMVDDALKLHGAMAIAMNGYQASGYFIPTLLFGTTQPTAIMNFGANSDSTTWALVAAVDYAISDVMSVGGKLAYASIENSAANVDSSIIELDGTFKYMITDNTAWTFDLAFGIPDKMSAADDTCISAAHKLEVKF